MIPAIMQGWNILNTCHAKPFPATILVYTKCIRISKYSSGVISI